MYRVTRRALAVAIAACGFCGVSHARVIESYSVSGWNIDAHASDKTNAFSHCVMYASYRNGVSLFFSITRSKNWYMGLASRSWKLTTGDTYKFDISLDGAQGTNWTGEAITSSALRVPLEDSASLFERFSRARMLTIRTSNGAFRFKLNNSGVALEEVAACTNRHLTGGGRDDSRGDGDGGGYHSPPGGNSPDRRGEPRGDTDSDEPDTPRRGPNPLDDLFSRGGDDRGTRGTPKARPNPLDDMFRRGERGKPPREDRQPPREQPPSDEGQPPKSGPGQPPKSGPGPQQVPSGPKQDASNGGLAGGAAG